MPESSSCMRPVNSIQKHLLDPVLDTGGTDVNERNSVFRGLAILLKRQVSNEKICTGVITMQPTAKTTYVIQLRLIYWEGQRIQNQKVLYTQACTCTYPHTQNCSMIPESHLIFLLVPLELEDGISQALVIK